MTVGLRGWRIREYGESLAGTRHEPEGAGHPGLQGQAFQAFLDGGNEPQILQNVPGGK
ncbi:MAG: hypothetical protein JWN70_5477, partial [Planctomycetaceae bacterium]|nr:hypothetical protein [Planctomycetaceae bacterium]